jgi:hypothetical protein
MSSLIVDNIEFHDGTPTLDLSFKRLSEVSGFRHELRISGGETPSLQVVIANGDGDMTQWCKGLLRHEAVVIDDGRVFSGLIRSVRIEQNIRIDIEGGV